MKVPTLLSFFFVGLLLLSPNLAYSNDLVVRTNSIETGIIKGATVYSGGNLMLTGVSKGELIVKHGGNLFVSGVADGGITNDGGNVEITGVASFIFANAGTTTIRGVVKAVKGHGKVNYVKGSIVGGKKIK